jgi:molecular chaperone DnaK (HSP70)
MDFNPSISAYFSPADEIARPLAEYFSSSAGTPSQAGRNQTIDHIAQRNFLKTRVKVKLNGRKRLNEHAGAVFFDAPEHFLVIRQFEIRIQASGGLSDADIQRMVKEAEENAAVDKTRRELVEAKNQGEALVHSTEKSLKDYGDKVSAADKTGIETALDAVKTALAGEDLEVIKSRTTDLMQASMKLGEAMYAAQAAADAETGAGDGDAKAKEDVIDADFKDVTDDKGDKKKSA